MNSIQKKILSLSAILLFSMAVMWSVLTLYNQKTQERYNDILQRYLQMNEVSERSQLLITTFNNFYQAPSVIGQSDLNVIKGQLNHAKQKIGELRNKDNNFTLTNYMNMVDSLIESVDLSVMFLNQKNNEAAITRFSDAMRLANYIAEMTLTLIDKELKTYDIFYRDIIVQSSALKTLGFLILGLITILLLVFTYWFSLSITRPIQRLSFAARELSRGRFDLKIDVQSNDEIAFLAKTFDQMRGNINNLISEIQTKAQLEIELQESRLLLKESQLRSLQSQINPHFLFNTLDTLSKKAYLEGSEQTSDLIVSVASLLRYNLRHLDRAVTLRDELDVMNKYIEIQRARFTDRLNFHAEVDESCLYVQVPSLTIQPVVENAVIHAIEPAEDGGTIFFRVIAEDDRVIVEIEDNGIGISKEKIDQIVDDNQSPAHSPLIDQQQGHSTGIGMSNVIRRLRLFYNRDDVIEIVSVPGQGTLVKLLLPIRRGDER
ncbi:MAG: histidine kinase [Candidatus Cohnella colombiensis]|uniref:histidine kinase n=1 Tax=Candidatus Cohnella colombiensis TaxID=3121368 RepID=A0AA95JHC6_9BACL|nr:MAG: histidine kinase [Cohnella sp.]